MFTTGSKLFFGATALSVACAVVFAASTGGPTGIMGTVGLLSLATRYGEVREEEIEQLAWQGVDGIDRRADVRRHLFTQEVDA